MVFESTEDAFDRAQRASVKAFEIGQMVQLYRVYHPVGTWIKVKVTNIFETVDHTVLVYELRSADGSYYYATKDYIEK